ncbi:MAG TPA: hypothetical protein VKB91_06930, partial [Gemmatimonadaceae bacterium]|nr:hypothetical protein [Gemmatimonadaceae bacterium]
MAAAHLGVLGSAMAQSNANDPSHTDLGRQQTNPSFAPIKQIDAGVLNVGYTDSGPISGPAVILLHGWPYDIHA